MAKLTKIKFYVYSWNSSQPIFVCPNEREKTKPNTHFPYFSVIQCWLVKCMVFSRSTGRSGLVFLHLCVVNGFCTVVRLRVLSYIMIKFLVCLPIFPVFIIEIYYHKWRSYIRYRIIWLRSSSQANVPIASRQPPTASNTISFFQKTKNYSKDVQCSTDEKFNPVRLYNAWKIQCTYGERVNLDVFLIGECISFVFKQEKRNCRKTRKQKRLEYVSISMVSMRLDYYARAPKKRTDKKITGTNKMYRKWTKTAHKKKSFFEIPKANKMRTRFIVVSLTIHIMLVLSKMSKHGTSQTLTDSQPSLCFSFSLNIFFFLNRKIDKFFFSPLLWCVQWQLVRT